MRFMILPATALAFALAACGSSGDSTTAETTDGSAMSDSTTPPARQAVANLQTADGKAAGTATATETPDGLTLALQVEGMTEGEHGVHVHMTGLCEGPAFESAGGHWNPATTQHGLENPLGQHAGDMPNLTVAADGTGSLEYQLKGGSFDGLLDADGSAFVIHADKDDQTTDPSGNSGGRIACGVFNAA